MNQRVVIVGAGFAGLSLAFELGCLGVPCLVLADDTASCASDVAQGVVSVKGHIHADDVLFAAKLEGHQFLKKSLERIEKVSGSVIDKDLKGVWEPFVDEFHLAKIQKRVFRNKPWDDRNAKLIGYQELGQDLTGFEGAISYPDDYWLDARSYLMALRKAIGVQGGLFVRGRANRLIHQDPSIWLVNTDQGEEVIGADLFLCIGAEIGRYPEFIGEPLLGSLKGVGGRVLRGSRVARRQQERTLLFGKKSLRICRDKVIVGSTSHPSFVLRSLRGTDPHVECPENADWANIWSEWGMSLMGGPFASNFSYGVRVRARDRKPLLGRWRSSSGLGSPYILSGFFRNGLQLAGLLSHSVARQYVSGQTDKWLEAFDLNRH